MTKGVGDRVESQEQTAQPWIAVVQYTYVDLTITIPAAVQHNGVTIAPADRLRGSVTA